MSEILDTVRSAYFGGLLSGIALGIAITMFISEVHERRKKK